MYSNGHPQYPIRLVHGVLEPSSTDSGHCLQRHVRTRAPAARFRVFWYLPPSPPRTSQWDTTSYTAFPASTGSTPSKCSVQRTLLAKSTVRSLVFGGDGTHSYSVLHQTEKDVACLASELASSTKRNQLEQLASRQKAELIQLRDHTTKYDRAINKILSDLKSREWEVK